MGLLKWALIVGSGLLAVSVAKKATSAGTESDPTNTSPSSTSTPAGVISQPVTLDPNLVVHGINYASHPDEVLVWNKRTGVSTWMPGDPLQIEAASHAMPAAGIWYDQPYVPPGSGLPVATAMAVVTKYAGVPTG